MWSGPRNVSTALMYAFAQRDDTRVIDEPLYAHYLRVSGARHPGRELVLASQETDGRRVIEKVILGPSDRAILFIKQMAHHMTGLEAESDIKFDFLDRVESAFLVRDPREMLPSLAKVVPDPDLSSTGLEWQSKLHKRVVDQGLNPVVLDARELLLNPEVVLEKVCHRLQIAFDSRMLTWPAGPRPEDGVWAPYWYSNVHKSTGFEPYQPKQEPFPEKLEPLLEECRPHYEYLRQFVIRRS
jgi:hypothetical protein